MNTGWTNNPVTLIMTRNTGCRDCAESVAYAKRDEFTFVSLNFYNEERQKWYVGAAAN